MKNTHEYKFRSCNDNHSERKILLYDEKKIAYSEFLIETTLLKNVTYFFLYRDNSKYTDPIDFLSAPIINSSRYFLEEMRKTTESVKNNECLKLNVDEFNRKFPNMRLIVLNIDSHSSLQLNIIAKYHDLFFKFNTDKDVDSGPIITKFKDLVKLANSLSIYPVSLFNNLHILQSLQDISSDQFINYSDVKDSINMLIKPLPEIGSISDDSYKTDLLIDMLMRCGEKRKSSQRFTYQNVRSHNIKFTITERYCKINFFGIKFVLFDNLTISQCKQDKAFKYVMGYLQSVDKFDLLLNKLELQLLL